MTLDRLADVIDRKLGAPPRTLIEAQEQRWLDESLRLTARSGQSPRGILRSPRVWVAAPLALAAAAALAIWALPSPRGETAERGAAPASLAATFDMELLAADSARRVELGPGEVIVLAPGTASHLRRTDAAATSIEISHGELSLDLPSGTGRSWSVVAGPYRVSVVGTAFSVGWRPADGELAVSVQRGGVRVSGGEIGAPGRLLQAGDRLVTRSPSGAPATSPAPADSTPASADPAPNSTASSSWRALALRRSYRGALAAAEREGFAELCASLSAAELASLSDVARLAGAGARANQALGALRQRFPGTPEAATAAFMLGRQGRSRVHASWLETYLSEAPRGSYAQEALGRLVVMYRGIGDLERARAAARRYLAAYPAGAYAEHARAVLAAAPPAPSR